MASNTTKEVLHDLSPLVKVYKDGFVERLMDPPNVPPSPETPTTDVASKDIVISLEVKARLYLPKLTKPTRNSPFYDSARGNIAHNIVLRAGEEPFPGNVKFLGLLLSHSYFWGSKPIGRESKEDLNGFAFNVWMCIYPSAPGGIDHRGIDNPMINPFAEDTPNLSGLACSWLLVCLAEKDAFTPRGILYAETVKESGWNGEMQLVVVDGEVHCFHVYDPHTEKAKNLIKQLAAFISQ
ncbi:2-hydroxyisoflavanone dehydratase-like [Olea europaea subsp. europaea]|uniref:2-hydroxyisoflavanone dehydratase-like n=1 Tax=Olea europaea subsp. europaea TaxID=158383 RepID=A0A8S0ULM4_OLEEU|nr:2-hydroxyisoflavanone dehydratase-like [Olea europaea subsp. europaea]